MRNPRVSKKEQGLIKGALRRVFGRSDLRRKVIDSHVMKDYHDPKRKRVKYWIKCTDCGKPEAKSNIQLDHVNPIIPVYTSFEDMSLDLVVNRIWCHESELKPMCKPCHHKKTLTENRERRKLKNEKTKGT